jgi:hypothetical protein
MPTTTASSTIDQTTLANLAKIIEIPDGVDPTIFITTANQLVTDVCGGFGYSAGKMALIELWLAAHFLATSDLGQESRLTSETLSDGSQAYMNKVDFNLKLTTYGQQALILDTEGGLAQLAKADGGKLQLDWLGKSPIGQYR